MSESKHTHGPWRQAHVVSAYETKRRVIIASEESQYAGCPVCEVYGTTDDDCVANAKLIAAAPEMLAALHALVEWTNQSSGTSRMVVEKAKAAIAKAEDLR